MWVLHIIRQFLTEFNFNRYHLVTPILLLVFSSSSIVFSVDSFNVDWHYPIIIKTVQESGYGNSPQNYFGASVNLLKPEQGDYSWVVIGAPKGNSTFPQHHDIPEPGAIWKCTLGKKPADECRPVVMDPSGNFGNGTIYEWKNGSLLGGANGMALSSKNFVACASRLEKWQEGKGSTNIPISYMHGSCYVRPKSHLLQVGNLSEQQEKNFEHLNPLQEPAYENESPFRNGQAGFAVHFSKSGNELAMGAPGLNRWMGSLIQYISRDGGVTFTKSSVSKPSSCPHSGLGCFNYLGYSLTSGYFFERDINTVNNAAPVYYAAGAPRATNLTGKVVIFRFPDESNKDLIIQQEISGSQTGAYFGSSLLALDLDGDGYDDLVVGSPRFSRDQKLRGRGPLAAPLIDAKGFDRFRGYGDEGAVFIYYSSNYGRGRLVRQSTIIRGGNRPWSHFGTALISLGDMNGDTYNDFAVSAPFEDTSGVVYIYHGSKDKNIIKHSQVIYGKKVDSGIRGFGFSLAGSTDIDGNGFNDIAIGSFNSSQVVVLRAKPIISVYGVVKSTLNKLPLNTDTFQIESCVTIIVANNHYNPPTVQLTIELSADTQFQPHRVHIGGKNDFGGSTSSSYKYPQAVSQPNEEICTEFIAIVKEPLESSAAPVVFHQDIRIEDESQEIIKPRNMIIPLKTGVMYSTGAKLSDFCHTCPLINVTGKPTSIDLQLPLEVPCGDDVLCQADLSLEVSFHEVDSSSGKLQDFVVGSSPSLTMEIQMRNSNETAILPAVLVSWLKLKLKRLPADCSLYDEDGTNTTYKCSFGRFLEMNQSASVSLEFDMTSLVVSESGRMETELIWNITAQTVSELEGNVSKSVQLPLSYNADPHIDGSRRFEVFNAATLWKYTVFTHTFEVNMDGPSPVADIIAVFQLPVNLTTESKTIVHVRGVEVDVDGVGTTTLSCQATRGHFSKNDEALGSDDKVEFDDVYSGGIGGILTSDKDVSRGSNFSFVEKNRLLLHCASPFVACMEVLCKQTVAVYHPGTRTFITFIIDMASDDIRDLMKTHKVSSIQVESQGKLILSSVVTDIQPTSHKPDEAISITLIELEGHKPISKWIYILAVVIGILVLVCVAFCLYACGCFEDDKRAPVGEKDTVDGADSRSEGTCEEMQPLQEKPDDGQPKADGSDDNTDANDDNDQRCEIASPFSDCIDPPEFIPSHPTIPEEDENEDNK